MVLFWGKYNLSSKNRKVLSNINKKISKIKFYYLTECVKKLNIKCNQLFGKCYLIYWIDYQISGSNVNSLLTD